jgi:hypothetical protein
VGGVILGFLLIEGFFQLVGIDGATASDAGFKIGRFSRELKDTYGLSLHGMVLVIVVLVVFVIWVIINYTMDEKFKCEHPEAWALKEMVEAKKSKAEWMSCLVIVIAVVIIAVIVIAIVGLNNNNAKSNVSHYYSIYTISSQNCDVCNFVKNQ